MTAAPPETFPVELLDESIRSHADPASPRNARMRAARGMLPLSPHQLVQVLAALTCDPDEGLASEAFASLINMPAGILTQVVKETLPDPVFLVLGQVLVGSEELSEQLVMNRAVPDAAVTLLVKHTEYVKIIEAAGAAHERLGRSEGLVVAILGNPLTPPSVAAYTAELATRGGMDVAALLTRATQSQAPAQPAAEPLPESAIIPSGDELVDDTGDGDLDVGFDDIARQATAADAPQDAVIPTEELIEDHGEAEGDLEFPDFLVEEGEAPEAEQRKSLYEAVQTMNVSEKIKLANLGNKEARQLLIRDSNKLVATAAIRSPKITDPEVVSVAQSRTVHEEVIRIITMNKDWTKLYPVKLALAGNPKTPTPYAMKLVSFLNQRDLRDLSRSKNIPGPVAAAARKTLQQRMRR